MIVNAANERARRRHGAIHRAAGHRLLEACRHLGGCATGDAKATDGFDLLARFVIHTVGPVWHGGTAGEPDLLASCYRRCLALAAEMGLASLAFPAISTGVFGYPPDHAADVSLAVVLASAQPPLRRVVFCCHGQVALDAYVRCFDAAGLRRGTILDAADWA